MRMPTKEENPDGLHGRYVISKADGSPVDPDAVYFVLRLDSGGSDHKHVAACRAALEAYGDKLDELEHLPELKSDVYQLIDFAADTDPLEI